MGWWLLYIYKYDENNYVNVARGDVNGLRRYLYDAYIGVCNNPYKQAFLRGVKIIGATAHYVTNDLDEGPIIAQNVISVDHSFNWQDMQSAGKDVEKSVFSKAINLDVLEVEWIHLFLGLIPFINS